MSGKPASLSRRSKSAAKAALTRESSVLNGAGCGTGASVAAVKPLTNLARAAIARASPIAAYGLAALTAGLNGSVAKNLGRWWA